MEHNQEIMEQFLKLLSENGRAGQSEDLSRLLFYMDGMNRQLDAVRQELQTVKVQLAQAQDTPQKTVLQGMVDGLQSKVRQAQEKLDSLREKIMQCAANAVESFKRVGVTAPWPAGKPRPWTAGRKDASRLLSLPPCGLPIRCFPA